MREGRLSEGSGRCPENPQGTFAAYPHGRLRRALRYSTVPLTTLPLLGTQLSERSDGPEANMQELCSVMQEERIFVKIFE